jgi:hypothetical protein
MSNVNSAVTRISRFRHGEGGAEWGDALISMADIAPGAFLPPSQPSGGNRG